MRSSAVRTPDARPGLVDVAPEAWQPYLRLMRADRPVGVWLLFLPCLWGTFGAMPDDFGTAAVLRLAVLFGIGAFVMRSAGCAYNDFVDRDLDAKVARTANRPLPSGQIGIRGAWATILALCTVGFLVLVQLPPPAIFAGLASLGLVAAYPFMKRITWWPQAWLGLTFNWGVIVGAAAVSGTVPMSALLLYAAGVCWTLGYDTIYACQDLEDDALAGVKSSARRLGTRARAAVAGFYVATTVLLLSALLVAGAAWLSVLVLLPALHLAWQIRRFDPDDPALCLSLFKSNVWTGSLVAVALLAC